MARVSLPAFKRAIKERLGTNARIRSILAVNARTEDGQTIWQGEVLMFEVEGLATVQHCFAWANGNEITIVCEDEKIRSAYDAVLSVLWPK